MSRITKQMLYDFRADFNRLLELKNSTDFRALQTLDLFDIKLANASFSQSAASSISSSDNYIGNIFYDVGVFTITETASFIIACLAASIPKTEDIS